MTRCPFPNCPNDLPKGGVICVDHYFALEPARARFLNAAKVRLDRETDPKLRAHLAEQLEGYINAAIHSISTEEAESWRQRRWPARKQGETSVS